MRTESAVRDIPESTFAVLRHYLAARASFTDEDFAVVRAAFLFRRLTAREFLQRAGDIVRYATFVARGCLRNYVIDAKARNTSSSSRRRRGGWRTRRA